MDDIIDYVKHPHTVGAFIISLKGRLMMSVELTTLISIVSVVVAAFAAIVGYQGYQLKKTSTSKKDAKQDVEEQARTNSKLEYIGRGVDDIKIDMKANEKHLNAIAERVTRNEESTKQAHKRIDAIDPNKRER